MLDNPDQENRPMPPKDNVEELEAAGVLNSLTLTAEQKQKINTLSQAEVTHLKSSRTKVGDYSSHSGGSPWIL
jgi:hypothetical protein